ncbi:hypothetical protein DFA_07136 [Cavenderia fasciculata]|uniref:IPT/TIG domain-containing protein n=1 Tax=Cavenderia fasciculata TaxID=261658 RepID=F4PVK6_CACFS|nr:uncharacterized protein DFA_07136 [Cavenderia fasciculata]EGG20020.1 hypothetical protein DFA_07136 [Cavenderia fasciculata]|eukprot:XP_004367003.1 hypothetical protein DFA_07136 [Cavenderia fasciculata]
MQATNVPSINKQTKRWPNKNSMNDINKPEQRLYPSNNIIIALVAMLGDWQKMYKRQGSPHIFLGKRVIERIKMISLLAHRLLGLLLIGLLSSSQVLVLVHAQIVVQSAAAYTNGGSLIKISGIDQSTIEKVRITFAQLEYLCTFVETSVDGWLVYSSPPAPPGIWADPTSINRKRKLNGLAKATLKLEIIVNSAIVDQREFIYLEPFIDEVENDRAYVGGKPFGGLVTIIGDDFKINPTDDDPTVTIGGYDAPVQIAHSNLIVVEAPVSQKVEDVPIILTVYTGQTVVAYDPFSYVIPIIQGVSKNGICLNSHTLTIFGEHFIVPDTSIVDAITVTFIDSLDSTQTVACESAIVNHRFDQIECIIPIITGIEAGHQKLYQIAVSVPQPSPLPTIRVVGDIFYKSFVPIISQINPSNGLKTKGRQIQIEGAHLELVSSINIGGVGCDIDTLSVSETSVLCTTGPYTQPFPTDIYSLEFNIQATIDSIDIQSSDQVRFNYFETHFSKIEPLFMVNKGFTSIRIRGENLDQLTKLIVGQQEFTRDDLDHDDLLNQGSGGFLTVKLDSSLQTNAILDQPILITGEVDDQISTSTLSLLFKEPKILNIDNDKSFINTLSKSIVIQVSNFIPIPDITTIIVDSQLLQKYYQFKINGQGCQEIEMAPVADGEDTKFKCKLADVQYRQVGTFPITFDLFGQSFNTFIDFTYYDVTVTNIVSDSESPSGGDYFTMTGTSLDQVLGVVVNSIQIPIATDCTLQTTTTLKCKRPASRPGNYPVTLQLQDNQVVVTAAQTLVYAGPIVNSVAPRQWPRRKKVKVEIVGQGFGTANNLIQITIGGHVCTNPVITIPDTNVKCTRDGGDDIGPLDVKVTVTHPTTNIVATDGDSVTFNAQTLSCLGQDEADGSNPSRDWFLVLKMNWASSEQKYMWIDDSTKELTVGYNLGAERTSDHRPYNLLAATFDQLTDDGYYYIFYNDQPAQRAANGDFAHEWPEKLIGHSKGIFIWEDLPNGAGIRGIHIIHSNPGFPSSHSNGPLKFATPDKGIYWLGTARNNQHFFCYGIDDLNNAGEYLFKNDVYMLPFSKYPNIPHLVQNGLESWDQQRIDANPYLYDFLQPSGRWNRRILSAGPPLVYAPNRQDQINLCRAALPIQQNLLDICYWVSPEFRISGMRAKLFYKTSLISKTTSTFRLDLNNIPAGLVLSDYLSVNRGSRRGQFYDGIDLWSIVASEFQRKMFSYYYLAGKQTPVTEYLVDVSTIRYAPYIAEDVTAPSGYKPHVHQGGSHVKLLFPVRPQMDPAFWHDENENMVCFGDLNRHNNQGRRGGGALCIQHPELSYQLNRMVHIYSTRVPNSAGILGTPHTKNNGLFYSNWIRQPVQLNRPVGDQGEITVEVKEVLVNGPSTRMIPRHFDSGFTTPVHEVKVLAIRTHLDPNEIGQEESTLPVGTAVRDIVDFHAHDTMALDFVAKNSRAIVCDYYDGIFDIDGDQTECVQLSQARTTQITETTPLPIPDYPLLPPNTRPNQRVDKYSYLRLQTYTRDYDVTLIPDYHTIVYLEKLVDHIQPLLIASVDLTNTQFQTIVKPDIDSPFYKHSHKVLMRNTGTYCPEELTYLALLKIASIFPQQAIQSIFKTDEIQPNWANGIIFAISKFIFNELTGTIGTTDFQVCFTYFDKFKTPTTNILNIFGYEENQPNMNNPSDEELFYRSASAAWDWLNNDYADEHGASVGKQVGDINVQWVDLFNSIATLTTAQNINSMTLLLPTLPAPTHTETNKNILYNRYIQIRPPLPTTTTTTTTTVTTMFSSLHLGKNNQEHIQMYDWLKEDLVTPALVQLFNDPTDYIKQSDILNQSQRNIMKLVGSLDDWQTIAGVNQAIKLLLVEPKTQSGNQVIKFLEEMNRDHISTHPIELCYRDGVLDDQTPGSIQICSPMSIYTITQLLKQMMVSNQHSWDLLSFGDLEIYYIPKPASSYQDSGSGYIKYYEGLAIATLNSKLCDIQMANFSQFDNYPTYPICTRFTGPVIELINPPSGDASTTLTIMGNGFNTSHVFEVGGVPSPSVQLFDSTSAHVKLPLSVVGTNNLVKIRGYNLQRSTFTFDLNAPEIESVTPSNMINSNGNQLITVTGDNFGTSLSDVKVLFDNTYVCTPQSVSRYIILCRSPPMVTKFTLVSVGVANQHTQLSIGSPLIFYEPPRIDDVLPSQGDPRDYIVIHGDAFVDSGQGVAPIVALEDTILDIVNYTNNYVMAKVPIGKPFPIAPKVWVVAGGMTAGASNQFKYLAPIITNVSSLLSTNTGGIIAFSGYGWGNSPLGIDFVSIQQPLTSEPPIILGNCRPFETFVECRVPRGVGGNMVINASVNGQILLPSKITFSYAPPTISHAVAIGGTYIIRGTNLVPENPPYSINPSSASIVHYSNNNKPSINCPYNYYFNDTTTQCVHYSSTDLTSITNIQVQVGGQLSNNISLPISIYGFFWRESDYNNLFNPPSDKIFTECQFSLKQLSSGLIIAGSFDPNNPGHYNFTVSSPGQYSIHIDTLTPMLIVPNNSQIFTILPSQTSYQRNMIIYITQ